MTKKAPVSIMDIGAFSPPLSCDKMSRILTPLIIFPRETYLARHLLNTRCIPRKRKEKTT